MLSDIECTRCSSSYSAWTSQTGSLLSVVLLSDNDCNKKTTRLPLKVTLIVTVCTVALPLLAVAALWVLYKKLMEPVLSVRRQQIEDAIVDYNQY